MTYQEIKDRLSKCELALTRIKNGDKNSYKSADLENTTKKLEMLKEVFQKQLKLMKEEDESLMNSSI